MFSTKWIGVHRDPLLLPVSFAHSSLRGVRIVASSSFQQNVWMIGHIFLFDFCFRELLRDNPSRILMNLCISIIATNMVFICGSHYRIDDVGCKVSPTSCVSSRLTLPAGAASLYVRSPVIWHSLRGPSERLRPIHPNAKTSDKRGDRGKSKNTVLKCWDGLIESHKNAKQRYTWIELIIKMGHWTKKAWTDGLGLASCLSLTLNIHQ
jgi:hypothetical protein